MKSSLRRWLLGLGALVAVVVIVAAAAVIWMRRHPLDAYAWTNRRTLTGAGFGKRELPADGGRLIYFTSGEGPPLMLVHGAGHQAGAWATVAPALTDRYRVLVPDLPGHGDSDPRTGPLAFDRIVGGLESLIAAAAAGERAILVGSSMGAWLATLQAHRHPDTVARIVLVNGGPLRHVPADLSLMPEDRDAAAKLMAALRDPSSPPIPDFVLDDIVRQSHVGPIGRMAAEWKTLEAHLLDGRLGEIATPVDILWGESDRYMGRAYAERLAAELPRVRLTFLPQCGHVPMSECPQRFNEALESILAQEPPPEPPPEPAFEVPADEAEPAT